MKHIIYKKVKFDVTLLLQKDRVSCFECHCRQEIQNEGLKPYVLFTNCTESAGCFEAYRQPFPHPKFRSHILNSCGR